jgi:hypothetical protein
MTMVPDDSISQVPFSQASTAPMVEELTVYLQALMAEDRQTLDKPLPYPRFSIGLINLALIRASHSDDVFVSNRKSMTVRLFLHLSQKRAKALALLDLGATENSMSLNYARWLKLPILTMPEPWNLFNVNGTLN